MKTTEEILEIIRNEIKRLKKIGRDRYDECPDDIPFQEAVNRLVSLYTEFVFDEDLSSEELISKIKSRLVKCKHHIEVYSQKQSEFIIKMPRKKFRYLSSEEKDTISEIRSNYFNHICNSITNKCILEKLLKKIESC